MDQQRNDAEVEAKLSTTPAGIEAAAERVYAKRGSKGKKRRVTLQRDARGELAGAEIED